MSALKGISWNEATGVPRMIELDPQGRGGLNTSQARPDPATSAASFLESNRSLLRINDPASEFAVMNRNQDGAGVTHVRYQQMYDGMEVWGSDVYVHVNPQGSVFFFNGSYYPTPDLQGAVARISSQSAIGSAWNDLTVRGEPRDLPAGLAKIMDYDGPTAKQVIWHDKQNVPHLAWFVEVRSRVTSDWYYFIDAQNGTVLHSYNNVMEDGPSTASAPDLNGAQRTFGTYLTGTTYWLVDASLPMFNAQTSQIPQNPVGAVVELDIQGKDVGANNPVYYVSSTDNHWLDPTPVSAHYNALRTFAFYKGVFGRNSIDDSGMTIYSIAHVTQDSVPMDNAYWNTKAMCYGDGNTAFKPLAGGLDVGAHEMTHGVTQHTSSLIYQDQSGALNESMSDVFATILDSANWTVGEQVIKDLVDWPSGSLRDMSNPHNSGSPGSPAWQPATMSEFVNTTSDHGGVHVNSGIPNHAFYLVATAIGRLPAGHIWYKAQTSYLTQSAKFVDARLATEAAAKDLYGAGSAQLSAVSAGWDAVGVTAGPATPPPPTSHLTGANWILAVNTASTDPNSIYMSKTVIQSSADYFALSQTPVLTHPSVSDTSGLVLFVGDDYRLRLVHANPQQPGETILDTSSVWWSVSAGPGLSKIVLTTKYVDTSLFVFDYATKQLLRYKIRISTNDGSNSNTALYADAVSFDPSGRYILFDTYNAIRTVQGDTLTFWTINMLDLSNGNMTSVFPSQAQGVSVGDPAFSKTASNRFTFDYWKTATDTAYVLAADFFTGHVGQVTPVIPTLGYPTFSSDDGQIVFHTIMNQSGVDHDVLETQVLDTSKINGTGSPVLYVTDATFPFWFVIGSRLTGVPGQPDAALPSSYALQQNYPNPFNPSTVIEYALPSRSSVTLTVFNTLGQQVATLARGEQEAGLHQVRFDASNLPSGVYFYRLQAAGVSFTKKMIAVK